MLQNQKNYIAKNMHKIEKNRWHKTVYNYIRGVQNPMIMSDIDIGFLKTEPNQTDLKIQKPKTRLAHYQSIH